MDKLDRYNINMANVGWYLILLNYLLAGQDVSMMFESPANIEPTQAIHATSESFAEVVRLLEEEKTTLERKLDTATKVCKVEVIYFMLL